MKFLLIAFLFLSSLALPAQEKGEITISGLVLDSASFQPLGYVAIQIKGKNLGQSTNENGKFAIACKPTDTLVFSRLGYKPYFYRSKKNTDNVRILLAEDARLLKDVTIYDDMAIEGEEDWKKNLPSNTQVKLKEQPLEPDPNSVATFGPGITIALSKQDKTKPKRDELSKTEVYRQTITSPEVKKRIMDLYGITEAVYLKKLERFNQQNPDARYITSPEEIETLLIQFFALKD